MKLLEAARPAPWQHDTIACVMDTVCQQGPLSPVVAAYLLAMVERSVRRRADAAATGEDDAEAAAAADREAEEQRFLCDVAVQAASLCALPPPAVQAAEEVPCPPIAAQLGSALGDLLHRLLAGRRRAATKRRAQEGPEKKGNTTQHHTRAAGGPEDVPTKGGEATRGGCGDKEQPGKRRRVQPVPVNAATTGNDAWGGGEDQHDEDEHAGGFEGPRDPPLRWWEDDDAWAQYIAGKEELVRGLLKDDVLLYDPVERARAAGGGGSGARTAVPDAARVVCVCGASHRGACCAV